MSEKSVGRPSLPVGSKKVTINLTREDRARIDDIRANIRSSRSVELDTRTDAIRFSLEETSALLAREIGTVKKAVGRPVM